MNKQFVSIYVSIPPGLRTRPTYSIAPSAAPAFLHIINPNYIGVKYSLTAGGGGGGF